MHFSNLFSRSPHAAYAPLNHHDNSTDVDMESLHDADTRPIYPDLEDEIQQELSLLSDKEMPSTGYHIVWRALTILQSALLLLVPAYITGPLGVLADRIRGRTRPITRQGPTKYLDGLRGVACLIVYISHIAKPCYDRLRFGYGATPEDTHFLQLPIVRILHSGRGSVAVFFVISGFVITHKAISQIHQGKRHLVLHTLAGTTFRRPFRLFIPIAASTAITAFFVNLGLYQPFVSLEDVKELPKIIFTKPPGSGTLFEQYYEWFWNLVGLIDAVRLLDHHDFNIRTPTRYNRALWTIPHEFKGSLFIVLVVLMFAYNRRWVNVAVVVPLTLWLAYHEEGDNFLFAAGMLLAELSIVLQARSSPPVPLGGSQRPENTDKPLTIGSLAWRVVRHVYTIILAIIGLHYLSYPDNGDVPVGFIVQVFWSGVGAVLFLTALILSPPTRLFSQRPKPDTEKRSAEPLLQQMFTTPFAQYLGRISYALYLLHIPVNNIVGTAIWNPAIVAWRQAVMDGKAGSLTASAREELLARASTAYNDSFIWGALINSLILFWVSDVFTRLVDEPTLMFFR